MFQYQARKKYLEYINKDELRDYCHFVQSKTVFTYDVSSFGFMF